MSDWYDRIVAALDAQEFKHVTLQAGAARLLVTEHGGRILACAMPGVADNLLYHPPFMEDAASRKSIAGGDRLWIAPEVGWFWPSLDEARANPKDTAQTPGSIDPGYFGITEQGDGHVLLDNRIDVTDCRDGKSLALYATRAVRVIDGPAGLPDGVACGSFAITNSLSFADDTSDAGAVAGCWDILQVPGDPENPGTLICPTTGDVEPTSYYDPFGERHVAVDKASANGGRVRFLIDGDRRVKMGLPAGVTTGRMGYYRALGDGQASLIVRIFAPLPGEPYCDIPRDAPDDQRLGGDALQAYNDDGDAFAGPPESDAPDTTFGEMEYHDPALVAGQAPETRTGTCVTHVLVGPDDAIKHAGWELLGAGIEPIL